MGKQPKNHHYVPQCLLRKFCFDGNAVWYHYKLGRKTQPERRNIESIFSAKNYYTIDEDGVKTARVETGFYQKVDDLFGRMLAETNAIFEAGEIPKFEDESLTSLHHVFSIFLKRTKDFIGELEKRQLEMLAREGDSDEDILINAYFEELSGEEKAQMIKNARIKAQASESHRVLKGLSNLRSAWAEPPQGKQFVLGGYPIMRLEDVKGAELGSPEVELWMPVSPYRMLGLVHPQKKEVLSNSVQLGTRKVREINKYIFKMSSETASSSYELLGSLMRGSYG